MIFGKSKQQGTTIFFCSDVHGSTICFKKFLNAAKHYGSKGKRIDILMIGGDITGKMLVPIIRESSERYRSYLFGKQLTLTSQEELNELKRKTEVLGVYPHIFEPDEYDEFAHDRSKQDALFHELVLQRLREWMELAEERLKDAGVQCYISPGNDDFDECKAVVDACSTVTCPDMQTISIDSEHEMINLGYANLTPFDCPRDIPEEQLTARIDEMAGQVQDMSNCIFNLHCPPLGTEIDEAPQLDEDLRPKLGTTGVVMAAAGSQAVRDAIERYQPLVALHGHIHESKGAIHLGKTLCINPGSEYSEGILKGCLLTVGSGKVISHMMTSG